jgi:2-Cys peroxiredoxin 5
MASSFRTATRRLTSVVTTPAPVTAAARLGAVRSFHRTAPAFVSVGDAIPNIDLVEESPGNKVNLADEFKTADGIIVGVPAAFSGVCSASHVPSYMNHPKLKEAGKVFVVSVNDAFVMKAWSDQLDPAKATGIRFLGDPGCDFTKALELDFEAKPIFGGPRSKRYALVVENGKVKSIHVEPDNTGTSVSMAKNVLG